MAVRRLAGFAALAVVLLLCISSASAAQKDSELVNDVLATLQSENSDDIAGSLKKAAGTSGPQHAPQFPEDPAAHKQNPAPAPAPKDPPQAKQPAPAGGKEEEEKEDPCKKVPGCMECKPNDKSSHSRRLKQFGSKDDGWGAAIGSSAGNKGNSKKPGSNKPDLSFMDFVESPYNAPDLPYCTACNTTGGYVAHSKGRCACAAGYGDTTPTGHCHRCPGGFFSLGGFRAVCVECEGVAFSNADHTACVCASGWYGITSFATKQASCNQCPGSRPVSVEGARSASDCKACPEGQSPNEIYSECVDPNAIPLPTPVAEPAPTAAPVADDSQKVPEPKPLFNESTFADTRKDWTITTRNTQNHSNFISDFLGGIMDSVVLGKNITPTAARPGDLLYQVLSKPTAAPPKLPTLPNIDLQNPQQIGAGVGAALSTMPAVLGAAAQNGGKISDVVDSVVKAVDTASKKVGADPTASSGNGWEDFLKGLSATAPKDGAGKSELADFAKSLGDLFGAAGKVATEVAEKSDNSLVKSFSGLLSAAKKGETVQGTLVPESAKVDDTSMWSQMLNGLTGGQAAAPAPVAAPVAAPANNANDWTQLLSSLTKGAAAAPSTAPVSTPTPAATETPSTGGINNAQQLISGLMAAQNSAGGSSASSADIVKMLAGLAAPAAKKADTSAGSNVIATGVNSHMNSAYKPPVEAIRTVHPNAPAGASQALKQALSQLSTPSGSSSSGSTNQANGGLGGILGGLFGGQKGSSTSFSFANPGAKPTVLSGPTQTQTAPAAGFISVPSAPPKGSAAIKSGKVGAKGPQAKPAGKQAKHGKKE